MSVSSIAGSGPQSAIWQSNAPQRKQFSGELTDALQSGDLAGAQKSYADLLQLGQGSGTGTQGTSAFGQVGADFAAIGKALQSGDFAGAQSALAKLQQDLQTARAGHHHHHHAAAESKDGAAALATQATTATTLDADGDADGDTSDRRIDVSA